MFCGDKGMLNRDGSTILCGPSPDLKKRFKKLPFDIEKKFHCSPIQDSRSPDRQRAKNNISLKELKLKNTARKLTKNQIMELDIPQDLRRTGQFEFSPATQKAIFDNFSPLKDQVPPLKIPVNKNLELRPPMQKIEKQHFRGKNTSCNVNFCYQAQSPARKSIRAFLANCNSIKLRQTVPHTLKNQKTINFPQNTVENKLTAFQQTMGLSISGKSQATQISEVSYVESESSVLIKADLKKIYLFSPPKNALLKAPNVRTVYSFSDNEENFEDSIVIETAKDKAINFAEFRLL